MLVGGVWPGPVASIAHGNCPQPCWSSSAVPTKPVDKVLIQVPDELVGLCHFAASAALQSARDNVLDEPGPPCNARGIAGRVVAASLREVRVEVGESGAFRRIPVLWTRSEVVSQSGRVRLRH